MTEFMENLPISCPPAAATEADIDGVYRVVTSKSPTIEDFTSHSALNVKRPEAVDPCRWAACSFYRSRSKAIEIAKLPKFRDSNPHLALLGLTLGSGKLLENKRTTHIDFWMYSTFNPIAAIIETEALNGT